MKFIIPQNYKFKKKILGILDYSTAVFNTVWNVIIYFILKNMAMRISLKVFIFSSLSFPVLLLTIVGFNRESPFYVFRYLIKFFRSQKIYLFNK